MTEKSGAKVSDSDVVLNSTSFIYSLVAEGLLGSVKYVVSLKLKIAFWRSLLAK